MSTSDDKLQARVRVVNAAHAHASLLFSMLVDKFTPLVGKEVCRMDGTLFAKYSAGLTLPYSPTLLVYQRRCANDLAYTVRTCENAIGSAMYHEVTVYVGHLDHRILTGLYQPESYRSYTAKEVLELRQAYRKAREAADDAKRALFPFGEYDNEVLWLPG